MQLYSSSFFHIHGMIYFVHFQNKLRSRKVNELSKRLYKCKYYFRVDTRYRPRAKHCRRSNNCVSFTKSLQTISLIAFLVMFTRTQQKACLNALSTTMPALMRRSVNKSCHRKRTTAGNTIGWNSFLLS